MLAEELPLVLGVNVALLVVIGGIIAVGRLTNPARQNHKRQPSYVPGPFSEAAYQQASPAQPKAQPPAKEAAASTKAASKKLSSSKRKGRP